MSITTAHHRDIFSLVRQLEDKGALLSSRKVTAGFDGFIDTIVKIIRKKDERSRIAHFHTISEFGQYVSDHATSSFSLEAEEVNVKIGGNMPILSHALGALGIYVNCVGAFGYPQPHHAFDSLSVNCRRLSFADPGTSTAYEFTDGKIMVGNMGQLNVLGWKNVKERIGLQNLQNVFRESDLLCMVNWSEIDASGDIWKGVIADVMPAYSKPGQRSFFDLSDCSKRDLRSILEIVELIGQFSKFTRVTLGLNWNEAKKIHSALGIDPRKEIAAVGEEIFKKLDIECLIIHSNRQALAITKNEMFAENSFFTPVPAISTGAGDHFNAGFNAGNLLGLDLRSCLLLGHGISGCYVRSAVSPSLTQLLAFLREIPQ